MIYQTWCWLEGASAQVGNAGGFAWHPAWNTWPRVVFWLLLSFRRFAVFSELHRQLTFWIGFAGLYDEGPCGPALQPFIEIGRKQPGLEHLAHASRSGTWAKPAS